MRHACEKSISIEFELPNNPANGGIGVVFPRSTGVLIARLRFGVAPELKVVEHRFRDRRDLDFSVGVFVPLLEITLCDQPKNFIVVELVNPRARAPA